MTWPSTLIVVLGRTGTNIWRHRSYMLSTLSHTFNPLRTNTSWQGIPRWNVIRCTLQLLLLKRTLRSTHRAAEETTPTWSSLSNTRTFWILNRLHQPVSKTPRKTAKASVSGGWISSVLNSSKKRKALCFSNTTLMKKNSKSCVCLADQPKENAMILWRPFHACTRASCGLRREKKKKKKKKTWSALSVCFRDHPSRAPSILQGPHCVHHDQRQVTRAWRKRNWRWYQLNEPFWFCFC